MTTTIRVTGIAADCPAAGSADAGTRIATFTGAPSMTVTATAGMAMTTDGMATIPKTMGALTATRATTTITGMEMIMAMITAPVTNHLVSQ